MHPQAFAASPAICAHGLVEEHQRLNQLFEHLIDGAMYEEWHDVDAVWNEFSFQVESHLLCEEQELFPKYEASSDEAARMVKQLRADHELIRLLMESLGQELQMHVFRIEFTEQLLALLHEHTHREMKTLYAELVPIENPSTEESHDANRLHPAG